MRILLLVLGLVVRFPCTWGAETFVAIDGNWEDLIDDSPLSQAEFYKAFGDESIGLGKEERAELQRVYEKVKLRPDLISVEGEAIEGL